jgi:hypothetical protein
VAKNIPIIFLKDSILLTCSHSHSHDKIVAQLVDYEDLFQTLVKNANIMIVTSISK